MVFPRWIFCPHEARGDMASQCHGNGGDCDKKAQPLREPQPRVLDVEALCLAVREHAFEKPTPTIISQDTLAAQLLGAGHDQQLAPLDALGAKMQLKRYRIGARLESRPL